MPHPPKALLPLYCLAALISLWTACGHERSRALNIPAGHASWTLKEFARQSEIEIIFGTENLDGIMTNAVTGRFAPRDALALMLANTPLTAEQDSVTGAFAVVKPTLHQRPTTNGHLQAAGN